jgi:hypothetical protein
MAVGTNDTQAMTGHTEAIKGHHEALGGAIQQLEQALTAAWDAFYQLQGSHQQMAPAVEAAHTHAGSMHESAGQDAPQ